MQRPLLQQQLRLALQGRKLVLLCAPAGCGKTVALVQQLAALPAEDAVAWVAATEGDGLHRLLTSLLAALDPFDLPWRISPAALPEVAQSERGPGEAAGELARALEQADAAHGVIAVDDVHHIADARAFAFFDALLQLLPARWTVAMTSRVDPPLALARMRASRELAEFREAQLRFDADVVLELLRSQNPQAGTQEAQELLRSTGGWPAGLAMHIMALALRKDEPRASSVHLQRRRLFDYLADEVLAQLPEALTDFLLRCSMLPEWTARRCMQVSGDARAAQWLDLLEQRGLFVTPLGADELMLRPHDLFREFLQWRLARDHAEELPGLLKRAAEVEPDPEARIGYLLRAGATEEALREIMRVGSSMIHAGADEPLLRLIERFPAAERDASPELAFVQGLCCWHRYAWNVMSQCMRRAMEGFERGQRWKLAIEARALAVVALQPMGQVAEAQQLWQAAPAVEMSPRAEAACELVRYMDSTLHGPGPSTAAHLSRLVSLVRPRPDALQSLCFIYLHLHIGRWGLRAPAQALVDALAAAGDEAHPRMKLMSLLWSAWLAMWQGDVPAAHSLREQVIEEARWLGDPLSVRLPLQHLTAIEKHLTGDDSGAQEILRVMAEEARTPGRRSAPIWLNLGGAFAAAAGNWSAAQAALSSVEGIQGPPWPFLEVMPVALCAELALHQHADSDAHDLLRPHLQMATDGDHAGMNARLRVALARAELRLKDATAAWEVFEPLLREAKASGEILGLLMCGPAALEELAGGHWPADAEPALLALLRKCAADAVRLRAAAPEHVKPVRSEKALTERELQVLELVAQGQSNKVIARELDLSPHTIKRHMARIFDKTGQASRLQVAAWYRAEIGHGVAATH